MMPVPLPSLSLTDSIPYRLYRHGCPKQPLPAYCTRLPCVISFAITQHVRNRLSSGNSWLLWPIWVYRETAEDARSRLSSLLWLVSFDFFWIQRTSAAITDLFVMQAGSVDNYTRCCIYAIMQLEHYYFRWPNEAERATIKSRIGASSFFQDCVGFIDGTLINFSAAPTCHKEDYWTRKSVYALNSLIICDDQRRVIYAHHGWCGSAHDQRVLKLTQVSFIQIQTFNLSCGLVLITCALVL